MERYALASHQRAIQAIDTGAFEAEIAPYGDVSAWEAAREQRLHLTRGGRRRRSSGPSGPARLSLHGHVLATIYRQRLAMPCRLIGEILGVDESSISLATCRVAPLLKQQGITITPAGTRISTISALREYAAAAGITLPEPPQPHTTPESTLQTRDTPQTHVILGPVPRTEKSSRSWKAAILSRRARLPEPAWDRTTPLFQAVCRIHVVRPSGSHVTRLRIRRRPARRPHSILAAPPRPVYAPGREIERVLIEGVSGEPAWSHPSRRTLTSSVSATSSC